ncbi:putative transcriptional regulatory protein [Lachnellula hyalina]|uniref:Putative transcriptional regulatory protein n=1 Tax=Lachnellula hyalina TaxID=1316788 RepID=A0A8H8R9Y6_9HELO|nr:putative transcriptional regulatory protein [Lachnellula hyalina]TVY29510.1 putative transcriptional regulatory protein [Lachnellula hyalina]
MDYNPQVPAHSIDTSPHPTAPSEGGTEKSALRPPKQLSSASSYTELNFLFGVQDPTMEVPKPTRNQKRPSQGTDHTKHRRTRSGCYTCRSRRVKCDEAHPICERCRKGGRDCVYPEPSTSSKSSRSSGSSKRSQTANRESPDSSSDDDEHEDEGIERLEAIPDEDERLQSGTSTIEFQKSGTGHSSKDRKSTTRHSSETPSLVQDKGTSPTPSEGSVGYAPQVLSDWRLNKPSFSPAASDKTDWSYLPADIQFYLAYFCENISHLHYSLKYDSEDFMRTQFLDVALENEALLYAIVGFSAFQRTLHNPQGKIQDFLQYYNKAVSLLLKSLKKGERHSIGTLLAILQLATIEEFLGDWINLLGHQKAAFQLLTQLYTPETVMQSEMPRIILGWYMRFDVFAGLMGGFETVLSREWFSSTYEFFQRQIESEPTRLKWKIEASIAKHRLVATDMSLLLVRMGKGELSIEQFMSQNAEIGRRIQEWKTKMDPALQDKRFLVTNFSGARPRDPNSIVDPYLPDIIYSGPLWVMNIATIDCFSIDVMLKYQTALILKTEPDDELQKIAYKTCQLFEALENWPGSPPGTVIACQASLGIACLFLPKDHHHAMWARRKFALIESHGYIYPSTFRTKMADLYHDRSCLHWWLPNDENYPPIIRSIRKFVEERTTPAKDTLSGDLRDMKAIFASLNIDDGKSSVPPGIKKEDGSNNVAVASEDFGNMGGMAGEGDTSGYGYRTQTGGSYDLHK